MATNPFGFGPMGLPSKAPEEPAAKKARIDSLAIKTSVPANVLLALEERGENVETRASEIASQIGAGKRLEEVIDPETMGRAYDIADALYPRAAEPGPAPEKSEPGVAGDMRRQFTGALVRGIGGMADAVGSAADIYADGGIKLDPKESVAGKVARAVGAEIADYGSSIQAGVSEASKQAIAESTPDGDILDPSTWSFGEAPSLRGYAMLGADVMGSFLPVVATAVVTKSPAAAAGVGGAQGGGAAAQAARDAIEEMASTPHADGGTVLDHESNYFRELIAAGIPRDEAIRRTTRAAEHTAFLMTAPVSAFGGAATGKIIAPGLGVMAGKGLATRAAGTAAASALEEGAQEAMESVATKAGINAGAGADLSLTEGTFADFILGALGGGPVGAASGAMQRDTRDDGSVAGQAGVPETVPPGDGAGAPATISPGGVPGNGSGGVPGQEGGAAIEGPLTPPTGPADIEAPAGPLTQISRLAPDLTPVPEPEPPAARFPDFKPGREVRLVDPETGAIEDAVFLAEAPDGGVTVRIAGQQVAMSDATFDQARIEAMDADEVAKGKPARPKEVAKVPPAETPAPAGPKRAKAAGEMSPADALAQAKRIEETAARGGWNARLRAKHAEMMVKAGGARDGAATAVPDDVAPSRQSAAEKRDDHQGRGQAPQGVDQGGRGYPATGGAERGAVGVVSSGVPADNGAAVGDLFGAAPAASPDERRRAKQDFDRILDITETGKGSSDASLEGRDVLIRGPRVIIRAEKGAPSPKDFRLDTSGMDRDQIAVEMRFALDDLNRRAPLPTSSRAEAGDAGAPAAPVRGSEAAGESPAKKPGDFDREITAAGRTADGESRLFIANPEIYDLLQKASSPAGLDRAEALDLIKRALAAGRKDIAEEFADRMQRQANRAAEAKPGVDEDHPRYESILDGLKKRAAEAKEDAEAARSALNGANEAKAPAAPKASPPAKADKPAGILSVLSAEKRARADELKAKLAAKMRNQVSSGLDPEYITLGGELVKLYLEAGVKRFGQMLRDFAETTGLSLKEGQEPMRAAYNHVRDNMDLEGEDTTGMDDAAAVLEEARAAIKGDTPPPTKPEAPAAEPDPVKGGNETSPPTPAAAPTIEDIREKAAILRGIPEDQPPAVEGISLKWDAREKGFIFSRKHKDKVQAAVKAMTTPAPTLAPTGRSEGTLPVEAILDQKPENRVLSYAEVLGDSQAAKTLRAEPFENLSRNAQGVVLSQVISSLNDKQVLGAVIKAVPVDVMNMLIGEEITPEGLARNPSMLTSRLSVPRNVAILQPVSAFINELVAAAKGGLAVAGAKDAGLNAGTGVVDLPGDRNATGGAVSGDYWHGEFLGSSGSVHVNASPKQREAENYQVISADWRGLKLSLESPKGTVRRGYKDDGSVAWEVKMPADYGRILGTTGADGDHVDFYMGPYPDQEIVYVVDQKDAETGAFDEHKVMLGFKNQKSALEAYFAGFSDGKGPQRKMAVTPMGYVDLILNLKNNPGIWKGPISNTSAAPEPKPAPAPNDKPTSPAASKPFPDFKGKLNGPYYDDRSEDGRFNEEKAAFHQAGLSFLRATAKILKDNGWTEAMPSRPGRGAKPINPVSSNRAGPASLGEVSLTMMGPGGVYGGYAKLGEDFNGGNRAHMMWRIPHHTNIYGSGQNQFLDPTGMTPQQFAEKLIDMQGRFARKAATPAPEATPAKTFAGALTDKLKQDFGPGISDKVVIIGPDAAPSSAPEIPAGLELTSVKRLSAAEQKARPGSMPGDFQAIIRRATPYGVYDGFGPTRAEAITRALGAAGALTEKPTKPDIAAADIAAFEAVGMVKGKSTVEDAWFRKQAEPGGIATYKAKSVKAGWKLTRDFTPDKTTAPPTRDLGVFARAADAIAQLRENGMRTGVPDEVKEEAKATDQERIERRNQRAPWSLAGATKTTLTNDEAYELGRKHFKDGYDRLVPTEISLKHGHAARDWYRGWDRANLDEPIRGQQTVSEPVAPSPEHEKPATIPKTEVKETADEQRGDQGSDQGQLDSSRAGSRHAAWLVQASAH